AWGRSGDRCARATPPPAARVRAARAPATRVFFISMSPEPREAAVHPCLESETALASVSVAGRRQGGLEGGARRPPGVGQPGLQGVECPEAGGLGQPLAEPLRLLVRVRPVIEGGAEDLAEGLLQPPGVGQLRVPRQRLER